jgi:hypothetical protein
MTFLPGVPLPAQQDARERTLYHAARADGEQATMSLDGQTWQWRRLRGGVGEDAYGAGGWLAMQEWLRGVQ